MHLFLRMGDLTGQLDAALAQSADVMTLLRSLAEPLSRAADAITQCLSSDHKLLVCGNGGSGADAAHFATEFVGREAADRSAHPAICLTADGTLLTAAGNDYGFDEIFARQVAAFGQAGDVLVCLTTSGNSRNLLRALEEARARDVKTIALLGRDGGKMRGLANIELLVSSDSTARVQEAHMLLLHVLCEAMDDRLPK